MAIKSEKLSFESTTGEMLAARLDLPAGEPRTTALFAHCFTCSKDIFAALPGPGSRADFSLCFSSLIEDYQTLSPAVTR